MLTRRLGSALLSLALLTLGSACGGSSQSATVSSSGGASAGAVGTGGATCQPGQEGCACYGNDTCNAGLTCASHLCVRFGTGGSGAIGGSSGNASGSGGTVATGGAPTAGGVGGTVGGASNAGGLGGTRGGTSAPAASGGQIACAGSNPSTSCHWVAPPGCGDGILNQAGEDCDDGNTIAGDGCNGACKIEPNYVCPTPGKLCALSFKCGDGVLNPGEACDEGSYQGSPGCSSDCSVQDPGYRCDPGQQCVAYVVCGNSRFESGETCDPPNPGNGCSATCQREAGWSCKPGSCTKLAACGDGIVQASAGEVCDQGKYRSSAGCSYDCRAQGAGCSCTPGSACQCTLSACDAGACTYGGSCPAGCGAAPRCGTHGMAAGLVLRRAPSTRSYPSSSTRRARTGIMDVG